MRYSTPELVVLGPAAALVQGIPGVSFDNLHPDVIEQTPDGLAAGLDD